MVLEGYNNDPQATQLLTELSIVGTNDKAYSLTDRVIRYKGRIWLGNQEANQTILLALHCSGLAGHSGVTTAYRKVKALFSWRMKADIKKYVVECQVCSQN